MTKHLYTFLILALFIFLTYHLLSQDSDPPEVTLATPHNSIQTHLAYLQDDNFKPAIAAKAFNVKKPSSEHAKDLAEQLLKIYDGKLLIVKMRDIPKEPDYIDSSSGAHRYFPFPDELPDVYLEKIDDKWLYSKETISVIPDLYKETYPLDITDMEKYVPSWTKGEFLGIAIWQYLGLIVLIVIASFIYLLLAWLFGYFLIRIYKNFAKKDLFSKYVTPVAKPFSILVVVWLFKITVPVLSLPISIADFIAQVIFVLQPLMLAIIAYKLTELISDIFERVALKTKSTIDDHMVPLVRKTLKVAVVVLGALYIINNLGYNITPLLAGASIGGLALALAAKDALSNLFGSITIFADQPFEVGDWIKWNGMDGEVEEVGIRSTRVRTFYNSQISIPNGKLADSAIDNMGRRIYRRYSTHISVTYDTPPDLIDAFVEGLRKIVEDHPDTRKDYYQVHLNEFGPASINILFYIFFKVPNWTGELKARGEVMSEVIRLAETLGVRFAFPTQTIHIEDFPEKQSLTPVYTEDRAGFMTKLKSYYEKRKQLKAKKGGNDMQGGDVDDNGGKA